MEALCKHVKYHVPYATYSEASCLVARACAICQGACSCTGFPIFLAACPEGAISPVPRASRAWGGLNLAIWEESGPGCAGLENLGHQ